MEKTLTPLEIYRDRLSRRRRTETKLAWRDGLIANLRLLMFAAVLGLLAWSFYAPDVTWLWALVPLACFAGLIAFHGPVLNRLKRARLSVAHYGLGIDRIEGRWPGRGKTGEEHVPADHPYAIDLDLFGRGSLFELMATTATRFGEETLARWMCHQTAGAAEIEERQAAIEELAPLLDMREGLAVDGEGGTPGIAASQVIEWGKGAPILRGSFMRWPAIGMALLGVTAFAGFFLWRWGVTPILLVTLVNLVWLRAFQGRYQRVLSGLERREAELRTLAAVLHRFENRRFSALRLRRLQRRLRVRGRPISRQVSRLSRLVYLAESRHNVLFRPIAFYLLWQIHVAMAIERWRQECGPGIAQWLEALGELDALSALGAYAYERPDDVFPVFENKGVALELTEGGHPLLPEERCVRNTVQLDEEVRLLIVSGSNMSGKSTLLRTVGVNVVLAQLGAPVRCVRMRLRPMQVGATLRVQDSIQAGLSRFYAEIQRLGRLMEMSREGRPLLILLDELLHGTNSHDRQIGASALLLRFLGAGAIGLVTTHDLALTRLADDVPVVRNVHFQDRVRGGNIEFDYRMRPGVVQQSNALALMRSVGLDV